MLNWVKPGAGVKFEVNLKIMNEVEVRFEVGIRVKVLRLELQLELKLGVMAWI
jgi:hypothetical protein